MIVNRAWHSWHSRRGAVIVDRRGARMSEAALSKHVAFEQVDDRLARDITRLSWPHTKCVLLHATCLDLAVLLSRFSSVEWFDVEGAVATLAGELGPLEGVPNVGVSLVGPRLWSPALGASLEALRPAELALDATKGGGAQWRTPKFESGIDDAEEPRLVLEPGRPLGPQLQRIEGVPLGPLSLSALLLRSPPNLESVMFAGLPASSLCALADSPMAQTLEVLRWSGGIDDRGAACLASPHVFPRLRSLRLQTEDSIEAALREAIEARFGPL